jgi:dihydrofolate synthase / folylpolyglutamate synthase
LVEECHREVQAAGWDLSYYEFLFFVFCSWARKNPPEYLLLEVGLGGRLDAVNVFNADLVLLPSISRDHQEILGNRLETILFEKLGTLRAKSILIHYLESEYLCQKAQSFASGIGAKVIALKNELDLPGYEFIQRNCALADAAFSFLTGKKSPLSPMRGFLEHRGESFSGKNSFIFFGSHNPDGLRKLIQFLHCGTYNFSRPPYDGIIVAFSKRSREDLRIMLRMLMKAKLGKVLVTAFDHPKAAPVDVVEVLSREEGSEFVQDIDAYIKGQPVGQHLLVTGSYYFLGYFKSMSCCH